MALKRRSRHAAAWESPTWPRALPDAASMDVAYGVLADELVIRFDPDQQFEMAVVMPVTTPDIDYAGLLVEINERRSSAFTFIRFSPEPLKSTPVGRDSP